MIFFSALYISIDTPHLVLFCPCSRYFAFSPGFFIVEVQFVELPENKARRIQGPSATSVIVADQCFTKSKAPFGRKSSAGAFHPRVFLGRVLSRHAMSSSWSWENSERSVPLGRYWRSKPLVFSLMPRSQGACGWAK